MTTSGTLHETLHREQPVVGPSNRSFGITFAAVFTVIALWPLSSGGPVRTWAAAAATLCAVLALLWPGALAPVNRAWLQLGLRLHRIVNPVVMGVLFYGVVTPFGAVVRLVRRDAPARLRIDRNLPSYWRARERTASSMEQQF